MSLKNNVAAIPLTSFNTSGLSTSYQVINTGGLAAPCFMIRIINNSNADITISYDGLTDNEFVPKTSSVNLNFQTNAQPQANASIMKKGTVLWVKGAGAGSGFVYVSGYYNPQH